MKALKEFNLQNFELDGVNLIEASAGTGKTFTISSLYLRLVLERAIPVAKILVVTFTKAATAELKERLRQRLLQAQMVLGGYEQADPVLQALLQQALSKECSQGDEVSAKETLSLRLEQALLAFDDAAIFTIHGFCQKLLKNNALLTGQNFDGKILPDADELIHKTTLTYWRQTLLKQPRLAQALQRVQFLPDHRIWKKALNYALNDQKTQVQWPIFEPLTESDIQEIQDTLDSELFTNFCQQFQDWVEKDGLNKRYLIGQNPNVFFEAVQQWRQLQPGQALSESAKKIFIDKKWLKKGVSANFSEPTFFETFQRWYERSQSSSDMMLALESIKDFYQQAPQLYSEILEQADGLSYDDLLRGVQQALGGGENTDLMKAVQQQYQAALIDEFQDTDAIQYEIFKSLFMNEQALIDNLFVCFVGDPKQAIYHFRGADLKTYLNAREDIESLPQGRCFTLTHNYRSNYQVLEAINGLFCSDNAFKNSRIVYQPVQCGNLSKPLIQKQGKNTPALVVSCLQGDTAPEVYRLAQRLTAKKILEFINPQSSMTLNSRAISAGDIAILMRRNDEISDMQRFLRSYGIESKVVTNENIFQSVDAQEVTAILRAVLMPTNIRFIKAALSTRMMGLGGEQIATIGLDDISGNDGVLNAYGWIEKFREYKQQWQKKGAGYLIHSITQESGYAQRVLKNIDAARRLANLDHLCEILYEMSTRFRRPEALFEHFNASETEQEEDIDANALRLESDENMVTILSLHRSKGLEFPIVIIPYAYQMTFNNTVSDNLQDCEKNGQKVIVVKTNNKDIDKANDTEALKQESEQETLRLFYVAATRASSRLEVFDTDNKRLQNNVLKHLLPQQGWLGLGEKLGEAMSVSTYEEESVQDLTHTQKSSATGYLWPQLPTPNRKPAWEVTSYSGLVSHFDSERTHVDDIMTSLQNNTMAIQMLQNLGIAADDWLLFPRGAEAGEALHEVLEKVDFGNDEHWDRVIALVLARYFPNCENPDQLHRQIRAMLNTVLHTDLGLGWSLSEILWTHRISEMQFWLTMQRADSAQRVIAAIERKKRPGCRLSHLLRESENAVESFLKGFIDLVFEHEGRYYIVDWKSNFLAGEALSECSELSDFIGKNYAREALEKAMNQHSYGLQYLLYCVALHRLLKLRLGKEYCYETHMGGVFYLFLRGVREAMKDEQGNPLGVWYDRPPEQLIKELDLLLGA